MGLIAGIYTKNSAENMQGTLLRMMESQAHRGKADFHRTFFCKNAALGMVNRYDMVFCDDETCSAQTSLIHAFVDGIVLHSPRFHGACRGGVFLCCLGRYGQETDFGT